MKPSNYVVHPWGSVLQNSESETIACNIMTILSRTGNTWRPLTYEEYRTERLKDGNFSGIEESYFNKIMPYCKSEDTANLFCPSWCRPDLHM